MSKFEIIAILAMFIAATLQMPSFVGFYTMDVILFILLMSIKMDTEKLMGR